MIHVVSCRRSVNSVSMATSISRLRWWPVNLITNVDTTATVAAEKMSARCIEKGGVLSRRASSMSTNTMVKALALNQRIAELVSALRVSSQPISKATGRRRKLKTPTSADTAKRAPMLSGLTICYMSTSCKYYKFVRANERTGKNQSDPASSQEGKCTAYC